jgi:hypothetical protein
MWSANSATALRTYAREHEAFVDTGLLALRRSKGLRIRRLVVGLLCSISPIHGLSAQEVIKPEPLALPPSEFPVASSVIDQQVAANDLAALANDPNGKPVICFNPYLEPALSEGVSSNCMSCHARATVPGAPYPSTYHPNGWIDPSDQLFARQTKTDFVWAVQNSAR